MTERVRDRDRDRAKTKRKLETCFDSLTYSHITFKSSFLLLAHNHCNACNPIHHKMIFHTLSGKCLEMKPRGPCDLTVRHHNEMTYSYIIILMTSPEP